MAPTSWWSVSKPTIRPAMAGCSSTQRGTLVGIREEKDASEEERAIKLCNSGIMGFRSGKTLTDLLARIGNDNAKGEFYLTDAVALAKDDGLDTHMLRGDADEVLGVNSRAELARPKLRCSSACAPR